MEQTWQKASKQRIVDPERISFLIQEVRDEKKRIATLNGSFDLLHAGHLHIIYEASLQADLLIVCANSDESIRSYKGAMRPIIPLKYRLEMLAALRFVDYVTWFHETTPINLLQKIRPDVHVNGAEYGPDCIEASAVKEMGGRIHLVDRIDGLSTSQILERVQVCVS